MIDFSKLNKEIKEVSPTRKTVKFVNVADTPAENASVTTYEPPSKGGKFTDVLEGKFKRGRYSE